MQEELNAQRDQIEDFTDRVQAYMSQIEKVGCCAFFEDLFSIDLVGFCFILPSVLLFDGCGTTVRIEWAYLINFQLMNDVAIMDEQYSRLYDRSSKLESRLKDHRAEIEKLNKVCDVL